MKRAIVMAISVILALMAALPLAFAQSATNSNANPRVLPPQSAKYAPLSIEWWEWAFSAPVSKSPVSDTTGEDCAQGQSGHIWFLAGSFSSDPINRTCEVPVGKQILIPIVNVECATVEGNPPPFPVDTLEACAKYFMDSLLSEGSSMKASVDGQPLKNLRDYRVASGPSSFTLPPDNSDLFCPRENQQPNGTCIAGKTDAAGEGVYLLLTPLKPGQHIIHWEGTFVLPPELGGGTFTQNITYTLIVK